MKRRFWLSLFEEKAQLPDMTVREFCLSRNVTEKSYWYFHKKLADEMEDKLDQSDNLPVFFEVRKEDLSCEDTGDLFNSGKQSAELYCRNARVNVSDDISDEFLLRIMRALNNV